MMPDGLVVDVEWGDVHVLPVVAASTSFTLISGRVKLCGWSLREATGTAAATVEFTDGGNPLGEESLAQGTSNTHSIANGGVVAENQVRLNIIAGTVQGAVYVQFWRESP